MPTSTPGRFRHVRPHAVCPPAIALLLSLPRPDATPQRDDAAQAHIPLYYYTPPRRYRVECQPHIKRLRLQRLLDAEMKDGLCARLFWRASIRRAGAALHTRAPSDMPLMRALRARHLLAPFHSEMAQHAHICCLHRISTFFVYASSLIMRGKGACWRHVA